MAAINLADYLQARMKIMQLTISAASERSGISRQTWHRLLRADIAEARLSTLVKVARTLGTTPEHLINIYFQRNGKIQLPVSHIEVRYFIPAKHLERPGTLPYPG